MRGFLAVLCAAASLVMLSAGGAYAQASPDEVLRTGSPVEGLDASRTRRSFTDLKGKQGLIVAFGKSADWCPVCQRRLLELNAAAPHLREKGYGVAGITYDDAGTLAAFTKRRAISYPLLADTAGAAAAALGAEEPADSKLHLHDAGDRPAVLIIGPDGVIHGVLKEKDLAKQNVMDALMAMMEAMDAAAETKAQ